MSRKERREAEVREDGAQGERRDKGDWRGAETRLVMILGLGQLLCRVNAPRPHHNPLSGFAPLFPFHK